MSTRLKAILAAGAITSTVILALVAIAVVNLISNGTIMINMAAPTAGPTEADQAYIDQLTERQTQLNNAEGVMRDRQETYTEQLQTAQAHLEELKQAIAEQKAQNAQDQKTLADLQPGVDSANGTVYVLQKKANGWAQQEETYRAELDALNQQILALKAQVSQLTGQ